MNLHVSVTDCEHNDELLIREGESAAVDYSKSGKENLLPMARGLVAARRKHRSNKGSSKNNASS